MSLIKTEDSLIDSSPTESGREGGSNLELSLNRLESELKGSDELDAYIAELLERLNIQVSIPENELARIPKSGPFLSVSNHPFGGLDAIILLKLIRQVRPDFKVMTNTSVQSLAKFINPLGAAKMKEFMLEANSPAAIQYLEGAGGLGVFPAAGHSNLGIRPALNRDGAWAKSALSLIRKAKVPIVPIYFHGADSLRSLLFNLLYDKPISAKLPKELKSRKPFKIAIRIGKPISVAKQFEFSDSRELGRYLKAKSYYLGQPLKVNRFFSPKAKSNEKVESFIEPISSLDLKQEIAALPKEDRLFDFKGFEIFCCSAQRIPNILTEIGRLREFTFRAVGEGTNKAVDLDEYDLYYKHLFIWDAKAAKIVGAYRLGNGAEIFQEFGKHGFYIHSLFRLKDEFSSFLKSSVELGRSFVVPDYQRNPYALFILWKGILYYLLKHEELKYIIGPVSISNRYRSFSKSLIIEFISQHHFDHEKAQYIKPRKSFRYRKSRKEQALYPLNPQSMKDLESIIEEMELAHFKLPVLLKKYLKQNAKIIGFNVDPKFNNALDGLIYLDIDQLNRDTIRMLSKEVDDPSILKRFTEK
ncbi:MAG: lysophospholipid acyltransferase family protein [Bacteroidetes bacterium]|nr:lysophospholipid acyltransferase family protein [Bacteroidota bacterium]